MKSPLEIVQAVLSDPTNPDVVNTLVAHDATFVGSSAHLVKLVHVAGITTLEPVFRRSGVLAA